VKSGFTLSSGIGKINRIETFLGIDNLSRNPMRLFGNNCRAIYSWGSKPYSHQSLKLADRFSLPHIRLEDGFICSFGRHASKRKYSIIEDPVGIYYDATGPSRLENLLNDLDAESWKLKDPGMLGVAAEQMSRLVDSGISKYNHLSDQTGDLSALSGYALVVDQTIGDQSVRLGGMSAAAFDDMLTQVLNQYPADRVVVKVHPQVLAGKKQGYLVDRARQLNLKLVTGDISAAQLAQCDSVHVGTSLYGLEVMMRGARVVCYGQPFYAGWGLTEDRQPVLRRTQARSLRELFVAAYLVYPTYVDPVENKICDLATIIDHIELQIEQRSRVGGKLLCVGITPWKRRYINRYLFNADFSHKHLSVSQFLRWNDAAPQPARVLVWGRKPQQSALEQALTRHRVTRMEDGFVRSVGLGSNFTAPRSLVVDSEGIYFDATGPSRLESELECYDCTEEDLHRARHLTRVLLSERISKYTRPAGSQFDCSFYQGKRALLVVGQVDGDASLRFGACEVGSNLELIRAVRRDNPSAVVVYKPHPDVVSGNRSDGIENECELKSMCDHIETVLPIDVVLQQCDEVHTISSLTGLEALLYNKHVVTYGRPFYAGWGLTTDCCEFARRSRRRSLSELIYISYIRYPSYLDIASGEHVRVEQTVDALLSERRATTSPITEAGIRKYVNIVRNIKKGLTYAA
jgi:capsular polysaccharide export protein